MILLVRLVLRLLADVGRFTTVLFKPRQATAAENLILRRQIALFEERGVKPCNWGLRHRGRVAV